MTPRPNRRNPIVRHGELGRGFVQIPNELARDTSLTQHAYRLAIVMRTHATGFEVSVKSLAADHGWRRSRVTKAFAELVDAGWLAVRRYVNSEGHRLHDEYHFDIARRFTPAELAKHGATVMLSASAADEPDQSTHMLLAGSGGCNEPHQPDVSGGGTKEHHSKHYPENDSLEEQEVQERRSVRKSCVECDSVPWDGGLRIWRRVTRRDQRVMLNAR